jgi:hypothetical protein
LIRAGILPQWSPTVTDERVIPSEFRAFCGALGKCFSPPLSNRGLFRHFEMDGDNNELNRQGRTPVRGKLPQPSSILNDFLDKVDAKLALLGSELHTAAVRPGGLLAPWLLVEAEVSRIDRDLLRKKYRLDDYVSACYLKIDLPKFRQLEEGMQDDNPRDEATWATIISDLKLFWKSTRGKKGSCFLPFVSRLIVESVMRFNSHPPASQQRDKMAVDLFKMLSEIGRQSHYGRFQESRDDMELRHYAIMVRAMQYHAGRSVKKARTLYRELLDIPDPRKPKSHPQDAFVLNGKVPDDTDKHALNVLRNVLCFEVCLGMDNFGDGRWWGLKPWLLDLQRRSMVLNDQQSIIQSHRIEAEWHLCHLGMKITQSEQNIYAYTAWECVQRIRTVAPEGYEAWMEWEILKLESIIDLVLEGKGALAAKHDTMHKVALDGKLDSQMFGTTILRKLVDHIDLYVQFAIQLHDSREIIKELWRRSKSK